MSSDRADHWQMTRLRRETVEMLIGLIPGLERGLERGNNRLYGYPGDKGWTADKIIRVLIARELRKRQRAIRSREGMRKEQPVRPLDNEAVAGFLGVTEAELERWEDDGGNGRV